MAKSKTHGQLAQLRQKTLLHFEKGDLAGALVACQRYLKHDGRDAHMTALLGIIRFQQGFHGAALDLMKRAEQLAPLDVGLAFNHAKMLTDLGRPADAEPLLRKCLTTHPEFDPAANTLGIALLALGRPAEAAASFQTAVQIKPDNPEYFANLALALRRIHALAPSLAALVRACELAPADLDLQLALGNAYYDARDMEAAILHYGIVTERDPNHMIARCGAMRTRLNICDWSQFEADRSFILDRLVRGPEECRVGVSPYVTTLISNDPSHCLVAARTASSAHGSWERPQAVSVRKRPRDRERIRIAYVSADYREHATSYLIAEAIELHDRNRLEVYGISYGPAEASPMRARMEAAFDRFVDVAHLTPHQIAAMMRDLDIDVAIDLQGFNQFNRMEIFAHRAAPVQAIYLGWPGTSGAPYYDYVIADADVIPAENRRYFSESVVWLPCAYQPNDRKRRVAERAPSRADCGLPEDAVVLACLNNAFKILPEMYATWMRILARIPGSVLWLLGSSPVLQCNLRREARVHGIAGERICFAETVKNPVHLARHVHIDLALDTLPYNAHTTASDALWMGVPVLTCTGTSFAGRVATSLLRGCGADVLVTGSLLDYENRAVELLKDRDRLAELGRTIKDATQNERPPFDTPRLTRGLEAAYVAMVERQRQGLSPSHLDLRLADAEGQS